MTTEKKRQAAKKLAISYKKKAISKNVSQERDPLAAAEAMPILLEWARDLTDKIEASRELLCLASWLAGDDEALRELHGAACREPALALKCQSCSADQDACASTCDACGSTESCGRCGACGNDDCPDGVYHRWVRPEPWEVLERGNRWEVRKLRVVMLNDVAWAASRKHAGADGEAELVKLGQAECRRRGWRPAGDARDPKADSQIQQIVYVRVEDVIDLSMLDKRVEKVGDYVAVPGRGETF